MKTLSYPLWFRTAFGGALVFSVIFLSGCGGREEKPSLSGTVKYKGQPVTGGSLILKPADNTMMPLKIPINGKGAYRVTAPSLGEMKVAIETESLREATPSTYPPGEPPPGVDESKYMPIPLKYSNVRSSGLSVNIQKGKNNKDFELTD